MQQKILYVVDYLLHQYNSVRDILFNILQQKASETNQQILFHTTLRPHYSMVAKELDGYQTYTDQKTAAGSGKPKSGLLQRLTHLWKSCTYAIMRLLHKGKAYCEKTAAKRFKRVIGEEQPSLVVFFSMPPDKRQIDHCIRNKIPYIVVLYDTYIGDPRIDKAKVMPIEAYVMAHSCGYFVPGFFYAEYQKHYACDRLIAYDLPLLIDKQDVLRAYESLAKGHDFVYFGQLQQFRNGDAVRDIFRRLGISLDIYTAQSQESDAVFRVHEAVTMQELHRLVAGSRFCIAIDNGAPYQHYLPSKAYLYASFTKPIIAFGDNESSALKDFFADYPYFYYQRFGDSTDGLAEFLQQTHKSELDDALYAKYVRFLPDAALSPLVDQIKETLK